MSRDDYRHEKPANEGGANASVVISNMRQIDMVLGEYVVMEPDSKYISKPRFARKS